MISTLLKKPRRNAPNSDADNCGAEPNDVGAGIFRPLRRLVRATVVHIGILQSFFLQCMNLSQRLFNIFLSLPEGLHEGSSIAL